MLKKRTYEDTKNKPERYNITIKFIEFKLKLQRNRDIEMNK